MNCSQHDLKGYLLGEVAPPERRPVELHLAECRDCREELERLRLTQALLLRLPEEEIPRRIAFVSDRVFEPRGWAWLWNSAPRLAFASAVVLSVAIVLHAFARQERVIAPAARDTAAVAARIEREVAGRLDAAVAQAVAESEARQARQTAQLVAAAERRVEQRRQADVLAVQEGLMVLQKKMNVYRASASFGGPQ